MANTNDNSELFEIFQNQVDLEQEQEKEKEKEKEQDPEYDRDEDQGIEADEEVREKAGGEAVQKETHEEHSTPGGDAERTGEQSGAASPGDSSSGPKRSAPEDRGQSPPPTDQPDKSSGNVAPDDSGDTDTGTGAFIKELENEKELEGKVILSRGASVFLLILAVVAVIGSYFIGLRAGSNQQAQTTLNTEETKKDKNILPGIQESDDSTSESSGEETSDDSSSQQTEGPIVEKSTTSNQTFYTFAVIGFPPRDNIQNVLNKHIKILRNDAKLNQVGYLHNPQGKNNYWIVVGALDSRDKAEEMQERVRNRLGQTRHAGRYRADIIEISSEQRKNLISR